MQVGFDLNVVLPSIALGPVFNEVRISYLYLCV